MFYIPNQQQYLTRFCFAMTVDKSKSQFLKIVEVDLQMSVFTNGQLHIALL